MKQCSFVFFISVFFLIIFFGSFNLIFASEQIMSDPNIIGCGVEYNGTIKAKAGDLITIRSISLGGFIASGNEPRFNQSLLPNHNWRGFLSGTWYYPILKEVQSSLRLSISVEHESSHATMGIAEYTTNPLEMVYDNTYRKSSMNGIVTGTHYELYDRNNLLRLRSTITGYFFSKNTPELAGLETGTSAGFSLGGTFRHTLAQHIGLFFSLNSRYVFTSRKKILGEVYTTDKNHLSIKSASYPLINAINTITFCGGITLPFFQSRQCFELYIRYLYGHPYGYIDSRDKRSSLSVGMLISSL